MLKWEELLINHYAFDTLNSLVFQLQHFLVSVSETPLYWNSPTESVLWSPDTVATN